MQDHHEDVQQHKYKHQQKTMKEATFKNCAPFTDYISEIENTQIGNPKDTDVVMSKYNLIEYNSNY